MSNPNVNMKPWEKGFKYVPVSASTCEETWDLGEMRTMDIDYDAIVRMAQWSTLHHPSGDVLDMGTLPTQGDVNPKAYGVNHRCPRGEWSLQEILAQINK